MSTSANPISKDDFDPKVLGGSIKRNIINPDLVEERKKTAFDKQEFTEFFLGEDVLREL